LDIGTLEDPEGNGITLEELAVRLRSGWGENGIGFGNSGFESSGSVTEVCVWLASMYKDIHISTKGEMQDWYTRYKQPTIPRTQC
jgi:hypothetical protein